MIKFEVFHERLSLLVDWTKKLAIMTLLGTCLGHFCYFYIGLKYMKLVRKRFHGVKLTFLSSSILSSFAMES